MMAYQDNVVSLRDSSRDSASFSARPEFLRTVNACRQALLKTLPVLNAEFYANLDDALFKLADKAVSNTAQSRYFDTMRELRKQRDAMESRFNSSLLQHFDHFWRDGPSHQEADQLIHAFDCNEALLVAEADLEEELAVDNMVAKGEKAFFREIYALNERFAYIAYGAQVDSQNNPVAPAAIAAAFKGAALEFCQDVELRLLLFKRFELDVVLRIGAVYEEINGLLSRAGVLPNLSRHVVQRAPGGGAESGGQVEPEEMALFRVLQETLGRRREQSVETKLPGATLATADQVCDLLSGLQMRALSAGPAQPDIGALVRQELSVNARFVSQIEADTIDVIAMIFDFILDKSDLPDALAVLLARLQIPMLKVAIQDKRFFSNKTHPARRLLNSLARAAAHLNRSGDRGESALYAKVEEVVRRVVNEFDNDVRLFTELHEQFDAFLEGELQSSAGTEKRASETIQGREKLVYARQRVDQEIANSLAQVRSLPRDVVDLINGPWRDVLVLTLLRKGENSDDWRRAVLLIRSLVWSVQPKIARVERQSLLRAIPNLLKGLRNGLHEIAFDRHKMSAIFKRLQGYHLLCLRGDVPPRVIDGAQIKQLLERKRKEFDVVSEAPSHDLPGERFLDQADSLKVGDWINLLGKDGVTRRAKLSWRSEITGACLFVNHKGMKVSELRVETLARNLRDGKAKLLQDVNVPLTDRALNALFPDLPRALSD
ncbi:MAG: hypothetical protein B0D94_11780 [Candidatus Sedimenticola endophacoides]|nr:MAG: hypothetical protein B0D94_11780 [Candidatus Sedimenticola endophacoides]